MTATAEQIETQATPRPWRTDAEFDHENILGPDEAMVADCAIFLNRKFGKRTPEINRANAELIVRAVNAHDALVEALEDLLSDCDRQMQNPSHHRPFSYDKARAALKLAGAA